MGKWKEKELPTLWEKLPIGEAGEEVSPFSVASVALVNKSVDCLLCCDDLLLSKYVWLLVSLE